MPQSLSNLIMHLKPYWLTDAAAVVPLVLGEGPGIDIVGSTIGLGGDTILIYNRNGDPVEEFPATGAGLTASVAASVAGDMILLPSRLITMTAAITIPADVEMRGVSRATCVLYAATDLGTALVTVNGGLTNVLVYYTHAGHNGGVWLRSITIQNSNAYVSRCSSVCNNTGNTPAYGIDVETGSSAYNDSYAYCTNGTAVGIRVKGSSTYDLAYAANSSLAVGLGIAGGTASYSRGVAVTSTTNYDIYFPSGSGIARNCIAAASGTVCIDTNATGTLYATQYDRIINLGKLHYETGDRSAYREDTKHWYPDDDILKVGSGGKGELEAFSVIGLPDVTNPVIPVGAGSDSKIRELGNILYEPWDILRPYKMFYTGYNVGLTTDEKVHYAYSQDGKTWTKSASNPVISDRRAEDPYVVQRDRMYYLYAEDKESGDEAHIRRWKSSDCEKWTDEGQISGITDVQSPTVWMSGDTWYMLYEQYPTAPNDVRLATSNDGLIWTADPTNPVFSAGDTAWVTGAIVADDIIQIGNVYYMLYHGNQAGIVRQGIAKSTNLTAWTDLNSPITSAELADPVVAAQWLFDTRLTIYYYTIDTSGIYRGFPSNPVGTIAAGVLTIDGDYYIVKAQTSTSDDLDTISGPQAFQMLVLTPYTGHTITIKHGTGNIFFADTADYTLSGTKSITLFFDGTNWTNASGGVSSTHAAVTLDANAATVLDITGQELGLDTQAANTVWAGPTTGAAAVPTFRALVLADLTAITDVIHQHIVNEDHSGDCDGAEDTFTTLLPFRQSSTAVYLNGLRQYLFTDYTEAGTLDSVTFTTPPEAGDILTFDYIVEYNDFITLDALLLEDGDNLLLENGDRLLLE